MYEFGPFRLDPAERLLLRNGQTVPLAPKAFDTLLLLVENSGHLLTKDELMKHLWPETFVEEVNLAQNISAIRRALDDKNGGAHYIETVAKGGYRFVGQVSVFPRLVPRENPTPLRRWMRVPSCQNQYRDVSFWVLAWRRHLPCWPGVSGTAGSVRAIRSPRSARLPFCRCKTSLMISSRNTSWTA